MLLGDILMLLALLGTIPSTFVERGRITSRGSGATMEIFWHELGLGNPSIVSWTALIEHTSLGWKISSGPWSCGQQRIWNCISLLS
jgi:hypothetical protein